MSDASGSCLAVLCGGCGIFIVSALDSWCNQKAYGSNGCCGGCCGGPRGCCHSCFDGGFNKDAWDEEEAKQANRSAAVPDKEPKESGVDKQPRASTEMKNPTSNSEPTDVERIA